MTRRVNKDGREIWFSRMLWSYMPCHWKGWLFLIALALLGNGAVQGGAWLATEAGHPQWSEFSWASLVVLIVFSWWVAERHSPSQT
jgi:hypothetical protein